MSEAVAERLERLSEAAEEHGSAGEKVAGALREDADFVRAQRRAGLAAVVKPLLPFALAVGCAFLLERLRRPQTEERPLERARAGAARVGLGIAHHAWTVGRDRRAEARKQQAWRAVQAATAAGFTVLGRRAAAGAWAALTGTRPPHGS